MAIVKIFSALVCERLPDVFYLALYTLHIDRVWFMSPHSIVLQAASSTMCNMVIVWNVVSVAILRESS
jgi:hypothetical protein